MSYLPKSVWIAALWSVKSKERLTDQDMADAMGCCDQTVANALKGKREVGAYYLHRARLAWPWAFEGVDRLGARS